MCIRDSGIAAGSDECRAAAGRPDLGSVLGLLSLIEPWDVVLGQLDASVKRNNVPDVELHASGLRATSDALELLLVFGIDVRPEHSAARLSKKLPIALGVVGVFEFDDGERIGNFIGQELSVLIADLCWRSFEMDIGPATPLEAVTGLRLSV